MAILLTCPDGHCFEPVAGGPAVCPVCGVRVDVPDDRTLAQSAAPAPPIDATLALDTAAPGDSAAATLGSGASIDGQADDLAVPGYEILGELGRGAMGVVYKARHAELNRLVALKMILAGAHAGAVDRDRFDREAEAVARLKHPHIVQIYEMGEHDGVPFFALEYIDGGSLAQQLDGKPVPAAVAAALVAKLARAVHFAHEHGIVHRDVKPANILLAGSSHGETLTLKAAPAPRMSEHPLMDFEPKIADFGLAKQVDGGEATSAEHWHGRTESGAILGTPSYMSPEQAGGKRTNVGPASDTYALGALLYELLTGRPPFAAATPLDTVLKVLNEEPAPPRSLASGCPRDLETVCLRCLAKDPQKRYASAAELADDLERFVRGEPVRARRAGVVERSLRWLRRRPLAAACLLLLALASIWSGVHYGPNVYRWATNQGRLTLTAPSAGVRLRALPEGGGPEVMIESGDDRPVNLPVGTYALELAAGQGGLELDREHVTIVADALEQVQVRLTPENEIRRLEGHKGPIHCLAVSPDGRLLISASGFPNGDETLRLWDVRKFQELRLFKGHQGQVICVAFSPDGKQAVSGGDDKVVHLWDVATGKQLGQFPGHTAQIVCIAFGPDGRRVLTGSHDQTMRLWDVASGKQVGLFDGHTSGVIGVAFLPDGKRGVSSSQDSTVRLWDLDTGLQLRRLQADGQTTECLALSRDGKLVAAPGYDGCIRIWDLTTGRLARRMLGHTNVVSTVAFSPDGRYLVSGSMDHSVRLWDVATGAWLHTFDGHGDGIRAVAFSPDGWRVFSAGGGNYVNGWVRGTDFDIRVWGMPHSIPAPSEPPVEPAIEVRRLIGHQSGVCTALASPDGKRVVSASSDGTVRIWDLDKGQEIGRLVGHDGEASWALAWSADSRRILTGGTKDGTVRLWDADTGKELVRCQGHKGNIWSVALSPDGRRALSGGDDHILRLWDMETGQQLAHAPGQKMVRRVAFAPDGRTAFSCSSDEPSIRRWDLSAVLEPLVNWQGQLGLILGAAPGIPFAALAPLSPSAPLTNKNMRLLDGHKGGVQCVALTPDGRHAVSGGFDFALRIWDLDTFEFRRFDGHTNVIDVASISADGKAVLTGSYDGLVICWDLEGRELSFCSAHAHTATSVSFAPGGRFITSSHKDPVIRVWQLPEPGVKSPPSLEIPERAPPPKGPGEVLRFTGHWDGLSAVAVSPDGRLVLTGSGFKELEDGIAPGSENEMRLWDAQSGKELRRFMGHKGPIYRVLFAPDSKQALSASGDGTVRLWDLDTGKEVRVFGEHGSDVRALAWSADKKSLITGTDKGIVRLFEADTGKSVRTFPEVGQVWSLALSPDGKHVVAGTAKEIRLGDLETGQWLKTFVGHTGIVRDIFYTAQGRRLVSSGNDDTVRQWDVASGEAVGGAPIQGSGNCMAIGLDGQQAVTGAFDGIVRVWDLKEGRELHRFSGHDGLVHGVAFLPDGKHVISAGVDRTARLWQLP